MLEASTQEASVTSQADDHCENEEAPKVSSANPMPSSGKQIAVQKFSKRCKFFQFLLMWVCNGEKPIFLWDGCILAVLECTYIYTVFIFHYRETNSYYFIKCVRLRFPTTSFLIDNTKKNKLFYGQPPK